MKWNSATAVELNTFDGGTYLTAISNLKNNLPLISGNQHPISISIFISDDESISNLKNKLMAFSNLKNKICPISNLKNKKWSISHLNNYLNLKSQK